MPSDTQLHSKAEKHEQRENVAPKSPRRNGEIRKNNGGTAPPEMCFPRPETLQKNDTTKKIRLIATMLKNDFFSISH